MEETKLISQLYRVSQNRMIPALGENSEEEKGDAQRVVKL